MSNNEREVLLEVKNLKQYFKIDHKLTVKAIDDISFKIYKGEKILFINKVENINNKTNALNLIKNIKCKSSSYINRYIYGSIFTNEYIKG